MVARGKGPHRKDQVRFHTSFPPPGKGTADREEICFPGTPVSKKRSEEERGVEEKERKKREMVKERRKTVLVVAGPLERTVSTACEHSSF